MNVWQPRTGQVHNNGLRGLAEPLTMTTPGDACASLGSSFGDYENTSEPIGGHVAPIRPG